MLNKVFCFFILIAFTGNKSFSQQWQTFANADSLYNPSGYARVLDLLVHEGELYVCGGFRYAGGQNIMGIAKWWGNSWHKVGNGIDNNFVISIGEYNNKIYIGGYWNTINGIYTKGIARFNGTTWEGVPNSYGTIQDDIRTMVVHNGILNLGGIIGFGGIFATRYNCGHDGNDFLVQSALPEYVNILKSYNGDLYAGGGWLSLKRMVGNNWVDVGGHCNYYIQDMDVDTFNNFLYVGGGFFIVDDSIFTDNVAIWNGHYWEKVGFGNGIPSDVFRVKYYHGNLYAGVWWDSIGGVHTGMLARWDGVIWHPVGDTIKWAPAAMEVHKDTLWVGGNWYYENGVNIGTLAKWYMPPDTTCHYLQPRAFVLDDTITLWQGSASAQFYNNNAFADSWLWDFGDGNYSTEKDPMHDYTDTGTYNVSVTVTHGNCVKTANKTVVIKLNTNVNEISEWNYDFKVFPNPTSGEINIECSIPENVKGEIKAFNNFGSQFNIYNIHSGINNIKIKSEDIPKGLSLFVLYINDKQVLIEKVLKN